MQFFINMPDVNCHDSVTGSKYAAKGVNWPATLDALVSKYCASGPSGYMLEINSHGLPGQVRLMPLIGFRQLEQFVTLVRKLIKPGGGIEILACRVADFNTGGLKNALTQAKTPGHIDLVSKYSRDRLDQNQAMSSDKAITTQLTGDQVVELALDAINTDQEFLLPEGQTLRTEPRTSDEDYETYANGPLFCSRLAVRTMTTVRAALLSQGEEKEKTGNKPFTTPIGNWEGHVLDFLPRGGVRYAGFNLSRPIFRTVDRYGDGPRRLS